MYEIKYLFFQKRIIYISENTNNKNYRIFIRINIINCVCTYSHDIRVPLEYTHLQSTFSHKYTIHRNISWSLSTNPTNKKKILSSKNFDINIFDKNIVHSLNKNFYISKKRKINQIIFFENIITYVISY